LKSLSFHPEAIREAAESAQFYEERQKGLGARFIKSLSDTLSRIEADHFLYPIICENIRRCPMSHFPYGIIYREKEDSIEIISVMHSKRKPGYWKSRG